MTTLTESSEQHAFILEQKQRETMDAVTQLFDGKKIFICDWLNRPSQYLEGEKPKDLLWCQTGCDILLNYVKQIDRGVYV